jgi:hypothetical protein
VCARVHLELMGKKRRTRNGGSASFLSCLVVSTVVVAGRYCRQVGTVANTYLPKVPSFPQEAGVWNQAFWCAAAASLRLRRPLRHRPLRVQRGYVGTLAGCIPMCLAWRQLPTSHLSMTPPPTYLRCEAQPGFSVLTENVSRVYHIRNVFNNLGN